MRQAGRSMKDYPQIEMPSTDQLGKIRNRLINEEMNYDKDNEKDDHHRIFANLNDGQKIAFHTIIESVHTNQGKLIFVDGPRGTSKTYLWKAVTTKIWSEGKIVLVVASCGITALLLEGGRTTHS
jgi:primosomal protein N'